jgi:drug/metabolite transporter (DMT)-like permease
MQISESMMKSMLPWAALLFMGVAWGLSFSLARIAVTVGGAPFGIAFWQTLMCGVLLLIYTTLRKRPLSFSRAHIRVYIVVALLGASIPSSCLFFAAIYVDSGVLAITVTLVPIVTYGLALALGSEIRSAVRMTGVICGAIAILLLVLPQNSLPDRAAIPWVLLACVSSICYALENIYLSRHSLQNIGPVRTACGMNLISAVIMAPVAYASGHLFVPAFPFGTLEWTVLGLGLITAFAYSTYVMLIKMAGPVFASQTGYVVTLAGVFWGIWLFDETHSSWVWGSLVMMMIGLTLVMPRRQSESA